MVNAHLILAQLRTLMEAAPNFCGYEEIPPNELEWLGKAHALVKRWNTTEAIAFQVCVDNLGFVPTAQLNINKIKAILNRAIADLEMQIQTEHTGDAFGPGAVYDFFNSLNDLIRGAKSSLFVIDPYVDDQIFDTYLSSSQPTVDRRLLVSARSSNLKAAASKFTQQSGGTVEVRESTDFHDRLVIVDASSCWVIGQSIKDAAKQKPTYLAPLSSDVAIPKMKFYEDIWLRAKKI